MERPNPSVAAFYAEFTRIAPWKVLIATCERRQMRDSKQDKMLPGIGQEPSSTSRDDKGHTAHGARDTGERNPMTSPMTGNVGGEIQSHIGNRLKAYYDSVVAEPVPDKFLELLARLDESAPDAHSAAQGGRKQ